MLSETKQYLLDSKFDLLADGFPTQNKTLIETVTVTLENTCLFGEVILHYPDMSYVILQREVVDDWRRLINWCLSFARPFYDRVIDDKSQTLLSLLEQEINPDKRRKDYVNPFRADADSTANTTKVKKPKSAKKKLKRGPQMSKKTEL